ncbi:MAG: ParB/RepB/Spo0J family partition protein [Acetobacter sp.]|nr:ParB/RepB/Spo0J family partition protein [Bacteroides sp.]MCM1340392.1 ParB/RepB/Spo0J family partition protein [Acetobacter sp.]MCM1432961.1 ParB/RepB/Spo0J family partition protein [Clostridiales bacterium]
MQEIIEIATEKLLPNPYQPRKKFKSEEMISLASSIKENGILQPLLCRQINCTDYYEVIAGERRLRASILANLPTVPCVIIDCDYESSAMYSIIENIQRSNLDFFEEAQAISQLINHFGMTQEQIGQKLGKSQSTLSNKLRLLKLPVDVRYFIEKEGLTERHSRALLKLENEQQIWTTLRLIAEKHMNVEQTEAYIESLINKKPPQKRNKVSPIFRDVRIFVNTVDKAIKTMKDSGIYAESDKTETDEYIEYRVRIPKQDAVKTSRMKKSVS